ncbi:hypothetical protein F5Y15DRAFT_425849 [Xylariaceae sp. FL0016]|nr:hypothetical protein F5Y15DRAFT_425849 [Xylariaceae sp. FL0016]
MATKEEKQTLLASIEQAASKAFDPTADPASRADGQKEFGALISRSRTFALLSTLNTLAKPGRVPPHIRVHLMDILTLLPQRPDGVRATLEFVFSVHPTSTVRQDEAAKTQKRGANITMESMKMASVLLSVPPATVGPEKWFPGVAPQLLALLDGKDGDDLVKVAAYVIGFGILGRKQFGAPGTPGWKAFAEPMLACINPSLSSEKTASVNDSLVSSADSDEVLDLRRERILVPTEELHTALKRLLSLLNSHPNPGLTKRLLSPLILPLWSLSSWPRDDKIKERYGGPARTLLEIYLRLSGSPEKFQIILENLLFNGNSDSDSSKPQWRWEAVGELGLQVKRSHDEDATNAEPEIDLLSLESKADAFTDLLKELGSDTDISTLFLELLQKTMKIRNGTDQIVVIAEDEKTNDPAVELAQAKVLMKMMEVLPDRLISNSRQLLELVSKILKDFTPTSSNDDTTPIALSLLNMVVTTPSFERKKVDPAILSSIEASLSSISKARVPDTSQTAQNIALLIQYRDDVDPASEHAPAPTDQQIEDRKTYALALQYITQPDSPAPVRSEGLNLLAGLIRSQSAALDIPATLVLLCSLLADEDDYINLRVMKVLTLLSEHHPASTTKELLDHYVDSQETSTTDTRLRFGEALLQLIQRRGDLFTGDPALTVAEALLAIAGRRPHRPKTEQRQIRAARAAELKHKKELEEYDGEIPDLDALDEDMTPDLRARKELLTAIVDGWSSRRGAEDLRVRTSALSLLSAILESNLLALPATSIERTVDLCTSVLTLETTPEAGILRRAAVVFLLTFLKGLADARAARRRLGFGLGDASREDLARVLGYVAQTDGDGLVQQHARDCVESLRNWQMVEMLPEVRDEGGAEMSKLAGLHVGKLTVGHDRPSLPSLEQEGQASVRRPRIEEVE